ncbi:ABC transporter ATP-binding protein [Cupriavidus pauculus]|uniref:Spermidine/putrescine import ATP-binding protein PotA n=1 Tax=Cupriavidus pauculus TaxID=82633 RepID=A0A2N5CDL6_9BURK|nr:ABC transporter ATP-binding protein [Cupriavidus pauculus]PLQ00288.1 polyamine ABC transporter ATP-binding protein [Cupriavidus pauculus]
MNVANSAPAVQSNHVQQHHVQPPTAVSLERVVKKYHDHIVLHELSLKIRSGEFLTLLGPSGCGKTTLLNLIAGFAEADTGEIFIDGQPVTCEPAHKRQIGIVFQNYALFPHMTVERNIGYGLRMRGVGKDEIAQRVKQAMELVKLHGLGHRKPRELSGGQQQRVALARALVIQPKVLLLDEPFSALDKNLRGAMQVEIREIQRRLGLTTVFVTHDQGEALAMSDRIAVMSNGVIRQIAPPADLYQNPQDPFVASFLGDVNILPGHFHGQTATDVQLRLGSGLISFPHSRLADTSHDGERLDVYVRPEHIRLENLHPESVLSGTVIHHVYQGDHINTFVDVEIPTTARQIVTVRSAGLKAIQQWPIGSVAGLALPDEGVSIFSPQKRP